MFSCEIGSDKVGWFKGVVNTLFEIVDEVQVDITEKGLKLKNLDRSHIMFVEAELTPEHFEEFEINRKAPIEYRATKEELYNVLNKHAIDESYSYERAEEFKEELYKKITSLVRPQVFTNRLNLSSGFVYNEYQKLLDRTDFWISTEELNNFIGLINEDEGLILTEDEGNLILISTGKTEKQFKVAKLKTYEYDVPSEPDLKDLIHLEVNFDEYKDAISKIKQSKLNDKVYMHLSGNELIPAIIGEYGEMKVPLAVKGQKQFQNIRSVYNLHRLSTGVLHLNDVGTIEIEYNYDTPFKTIFTDKSGTAFMKELLAPRIESEE
jgi:hypothetical protein